MITDHGDYIEFTAGDLPSWLRDDAPSAECLRCHRRTWSEEEFGQECRMTQPDGFPCGGRFTDPRS